MFDQVVRLALGISLMSCASVSLADFQATYQVPLHSKVEPDESTFAVESLHVRNIDQARGAVSEIDYVIPSDLTGRKKLFVRLKPIIPNRVMNNMATFRMIGAVSEGPCRWGHLANEDATLALCADDINEGMTMAKANCQVIEDLKAINYTCRIEYGTIADFVSKDEIVEALTDRYKTDLIKINRLASIAQVFGHEAIGILRVSSAK